MGDIPPAEDGSALFISAQGGSVLEGKGGSSQPRKYRYCLFLLWCRLRNKRVNSGNRTAFERLKLFFFARKIRNCSFKVWSVKGSERDLFLFVHQEEFSFIDFSIHEYAHADSQENQKEKTETRDFPILARVTAELRRFAFRDFLLE